MVLIIKPSVGLTLFTSSFIIFLTIVVLPALSNPLQHISTALRRLSRDSQHQDPHLLVFQTGLTENRQHPESSSFLVGTDRKREELEKREPGKVPKSRGRASK